MNGSNPIHVDHLRSVLEAVEPGVSVLELQPRDDLEGFWYLIITNLAYPKYVIGTVDARGLNAQPMFRCGGELGAREQWRDRERLLFASSTGASSV